VVPTTIVAAVRNRPEVTDSVSRDVKAVPTQSAAVNRECRHVACFVLPGFTQTHVLDEHVSEVVADVSCATSESDDKSLFDMTCKLCRLVKFPGIAVVTCDVDVKPEDTFLWTQQVAWQ